MLLGIVCSDSAGPTCTLAAMVLWCWLPYMYIHKNSNANAKSRQRCRYFFSNSGCAAGNACKFSHAERTTKPVTNRPTVTPMKPQGEISLDTVNEEELKRLQTVEINQLKKRYPHFKVTSGDEGETYTVNFHPTDPDWVCIGHQWIPHFNTSPYSSKVYSDRTECSIKLLEYWRLALGIQSSATSLVLGWGWISGGFTC